MPRPVATNAASFQDKLVSDVFPQHSARKHLRPEMRRAKASTSKEKLLIQQHMAANERTSETTLNDYELPPIMTGAIQSQTHTYNVGAAALRPSNSPSPPATRTSRSNAPSSPSPSPLRKAPLPAPSSLDSSTPPQPVPQFQQRSRSVSPQKLPNVARNHSRSGAKSVASDRIPASLIPTSYHVTEEVLGGGSQDHSMYNYKVDEHGHFHRVVFPSKKPSSRTEAGLLEEAVKRMLEHSTSADDLPHDPARRAITVLARGQVALDQGLNELVRQITSTCSERGRTLQSVMDLYRALFREIPDSIHTVETQNDIISKENASLKADLKALRAENGELSEKLQAAEDLNKTLENKLSFQKYLGQKAEHKGEMLERERDMALTEVSGLKAAAIIEKQETLHLVQREEETRKTMEGIVGDFEREKQEMHKYDRQIMMELEAAEKDQGSLQLTREQLKDYQDENIALKNEILELHNQVEALEDQLLAEIERGDEEEKADARRSRRQKIKAVAAKDKNQGAKFSKLVSDATLAKKDAKKKAPSKPKAPARGGKSGRRQSIAALTSPPPSNTTSPINTPQPSPSSRRKMSVDSGHDYGSVGSSQLAPNVFEGAEDIPIEENSHEGPSVEEVPGESSLSFVESTKQKPEVEEAASLLRLDEES